MQRQTARLVLVFLLVGIFAPAALALSAPAPHTCCQRKPLHNHNTPRAEFQPTDCCQHNCWLPLTVARWAHTTPRVITHVAAPASAARMEPRRCHLSIDSHGVHAVRAPPSSSIA